MFVLANLNLTFVIHKLSTYDESKPARSSQDLLSWRENDTEVSESLSCEKASFPTFCGLPTGVCHVEIGVLRRL